jgi:hypothetical protein
MLLAQFGSDIHTHSGSGSGAERCTRLGRETTERNRRRIPLYHV